MPEILLGLFFVISILGFALYGFVAFLIKIFGGKQDPTWQATGESRQSTPKRTLKNDIRGASEVLDHLFRHNKLDSKTYQKTRAFLEEQFADQYELSQRIEILDHQTERQSEVVEPQKVVDSDEFISAEVVDLESETSIRPETDSISATQTARQKLATAPWKLPDPPEPEPRRTFKEMLASFMLEKNIRWGELASGILIVGSAIGLVTSLRNELRDTIPYFSALLFLLVTAAINGAGIYTLKKWKLRNTSRGTLLIGLLLIPLNFLAACILSHNDTQQRELNDPLFWIAIGAGLVAFSAMTWHSGKCLVRKGQMPFLFSIIGCAIGTIIINHVAGIDDSTLTKLILSVPLVLSFLGGTTILFKRQWSRDRWSRRTTYRMFIFLGMAAFAFLNGAAMLVIRADNDLPTWVALTPAFAIVALVSSWFGHIIWVNSKGRNAKPMQLTGLSMMILGLIIVGIAWITSFSNPTVLLTNAALLSIGFLVFAYHRAEATLLIPGWLAFASFIFCGVNVFVGELPWNAWVSLSQLASATLSGSSGITLLLVGIGIVAAHLTYHRPSLNAHFKVVGLASGVLVSSVGLLLAIAASLFNPENWFDNMTATGMLGLASGLSLVVNLGFIKSKTAWYGSHISESLGTVAALSLFAFLAHAFGWNRWLMDWLNQLAFSINGNWPLIFTVHAIVLCALSAIIYSLSKSSPPDRQTTATSVIIKFRQFAAITGFIGLVTSFLLIRHQSGLTTIIVSGLALGCLMCTWSHQRKSLSVFWSDVFAILTALCVSICVMELLTKQSWCPGMNQPRHWLIQIAAISLWLSGWLVVSWLLTRSKRLKFGETSQELAIAVGAGLAVFFVGLAGIALSYEMSVELFADAITPPFSIADEMCWAIGAAVLLGLALFLATFKTPSSILGTAIVAVWLTAWALAALYFAEDKAVATGMRWLLPTGGAIGAALVASRKLFVINWVAARNWAGLSGKSTWSKQVTQQLINFSLAIIVLVVMSLSTIAIGRVIMFGGVEALGGPLKGTWFGDMKKDVSYGLPIGIVVNTFLLYAVSERRKWLATAGSLVFQYCVLLSVVLLFVSPHPKLASSWFVNILQAVSVGMTGYGFVWWWFYDRIEGNPGVKNANNHQSRKTNQLKVHTLINGLLITSLAILVMARFFHSPQVSGGWINSVGGPLGVGCWAMFSVLIYHVWREQLNGAHRSTSWMLLISWSGMVLVGIGAALFDRSIAGQAPYPPWMTFNLVTWGGVIVCSIQMLMLGLQRRHESRAKNLGLSPSPPVRVEQARWAWLNDRTLPLLFACSIVTLFAAKGMMSPVNIWPSFCAACSVVVLLTLGGFIHERGLPGFLAAGVTTLATVSLILMDPRGWFADQQPYLANVLGVALTILATVWCGFYISRTVWLKKNINSRVVWMSNLVMLLAAAWLLLGSTIQWLMEANDVTSASCLKNSWGIGLFCSTVLLGCAHVWNQSRKGLVIGGCLLWVGLSIFGTVVLVSGSTSLQNAAVVFALGAAVALLGVFWNRRKQWIPMLKKCGAPKLEKLESSLFAQLPIFGCLIALVVLTSAFITSLNQEVRIERYLTGFSPFGLAIGFGCWSDRNRRRWVQMLSLALLTLGAILVAWADLSPQEIRFDMTQVFVRTVLVLAAAMFVYGGVVSRYVRHHDSWLKSIRDMAVFTCGLALLCFIVLVSLEYSDFIPDTGCGMPLPEAIAVAFAVIGMIIGLLVIAVRPENDPFSLSPGGRTTYVYVAQVVAALLVMHLFLTMPFLFRLGIRDYWPYAVMVASFGGVGLASWLGRRDLSVLGNPFFNTAAILPAAVAIGIWLIDSKADHSQVTLTVGLAYLMISYTHRSIACGAAAILFGNLALWLFYDRFDGFGFYEHPQLWLIPPAVSVLIAAQINKNKLTSTQLALIRYVCATTIYLVSTSEIFINSLESQLWPPIVLAVLSVAGIFAGILLQIRAFLYLGSLFLLMAMVSMVSHAHQRLEHVWPWWVFGIAMGIAILVMFGLFEKRKNDLKKVVSRLKKWEL